MKNISRALVTGATGVIGFHLSKALLERGWTVDFLVRKGSDVKRLKKIAPKACFYIYDEKIAPLTAALGTAMPDIVFHLAALTRAEHEPYEVEPMIRSNVLFGALLLEAMAQTGCGYFVNAGTYWQHYDGTGYNPVNLYAATKQALEDILRFYDESGSIRTMTLKLFDVYCYDDIRGKLFSQLQKSVKEKKEFPMTPGNQKLYMVYIDDAVNAFIHAAHLLRARPKKSLEPFYAVRPARAVSLRRVVDLYQRTTGSRVNVRWGKLRYRLRQVMTPWSGKVLPGWKPLTTLQAGIRLITNEGEQA